jgi:hypothetical protein
MKKKEDKREPRNQRSARRDENSDKGNEGIEDTRALGRKIEITSSPTSRIFVMLRIVQGFSSRKTRPYRSAHVHCHLTLSAFIVPKCACLFTRMIYSCFIFIALRMLSRTAKTMLQRCECSRVPFSLLFYSLFPFLSLFLFVNRLFGKEISLANAVRKVSRCS